MKRKPVVLDRVVRPKIAELLTALADRLDPPITVDVANGLIYTDATTATPAKIQAMRDLFRHVIGSERTP